MLVSFHLAKENTGWVIQKIMSRLRKEFADQKIESIEVGNNCVPNATAHFIMHYQHIFTCLAGCTAKKFVFVYHVDDFLKQLRVFSLLIKQYNLLVLSEDSRNRIDRWSMFLFSERIRSVGIASDLSDFRKSFTGRRVVCGVASHVYPDKRKNEDWIIRIAKYLNPEEIEFEFIGKRWDKVVNHLLQLGFKATHHSINESFGDDYKSIIRIMESWDIALYMGYDEGSLGILDAILLNKDVLVSSQGFHLELGLSQDSLFSSYSNFAKKLQSKIRNHIVQKNLQLSFSWPQFAFRILSFANLVRVEPSETKIDTTVNHSKSWNFSFIRFIVYWINTIKSLKRYIQRVSYRKKGK